jgi:hypothetical protein
MVDSHLLALQPEQRFFIYLPYTIATLEVDRLRQHFSTTVPLKLAKSAMAFGEFCQPGPALIFHKAKHTAQEHNNYSAPVLIS